MERETRRSIQLREEAVRKKLQTPEGLAALHGDAGVRSAFAMMQGVLNARARSDERATKNGAPSAEAPERDLRG
jgi:hypothetical protein